MADVLSSSSEKISPTARLIVDLDALAENFRELRRLAAPSGCAAVVKADAYGVGMGAVAARLSSEGCDTFFVASAQEGLALRAQLAAEHIYVLEGVPEGAEQLYMQRQLLPVLNGAAELERWVKAGAGGRVSAIVHIDTGMTRLGFDPDEVRWLAGQKDLLARLDISYTMTHLACADEPDHPLTDRQVARFNELRGLLPAVPTSIGNSAGLLRGRATRGDLARPGIALYGGRAFADSGFTPAAVVRWQGRVLQVRRVTEAAPVGYGATHQVRPATQVATVAVGYADGYMRCLGNRGVVSIADRPAPVIGRVSMDLITVDVSDFNAQQIHAGGWVDLIGGCVGLDDVAQTAGTISYEILTGLGRRSRRVYLGDIR